MTRKCCLSATSILCPFFFLLFFLKPCHKEVWTKFSPPQRSVLAVRIFRFLSNLAAESKPVAWHAEESDYTVIIWPRSHQIKILRFFSKRVWKVTDLCCRKLLTFPFAVLSSESSGHGVYIHKARPFYYSYRFCLDIFLEKRKVYLIVEFCIGYMWQVKFMEAHLWDNITLTKT